MLILFTSVMTGLPLFARAYGWNNRTESANAVAATADGGFALLGFTNYSTNRDFLMLKVSYDGFLEWAKTYGTTGADEGYKVILTNDMGYALVGSAGSYSYYTLLIKTAQDGTIQWAKTYEFYQHSDGVGSSLLTSDGGFLLSGHRGADICVIKLASDGSIQWAKSVDGPNLENPGGIVETSDRGFVAIGQTTSWGWGPSDFIVVKLSSDGGIQWAKTYGCANDDYALYVAEASDGNLIVVGQSRIIDPRNDDILVLKLSSSDGTIIWEQAFDANGISERPYGLVLTADNCIAILTSHPSILKMDLNGNLIWSKRVEVVSAWDVHDIINSPNGDLVCGGASSANFLLLRTGLDGTYAGCISDWNVSPITGSISSTTVTAGTDITVPTMDVIPLVSSVNPTISDLCTPLELSELECEERYRVFCITVPGGLKFSSSIPDIKLHLHSPDGRLVYSGQLQKGENRISLGRGVYLWQAGGYKGKAVVR